jgi:DNA ligase-1
MFKPLLAPGEDPKSFPDYFKKLQYPLLCSPKYDGIRCIVKAGKCLSRSGKILPSLQVQEQYWYLKDLDGELIEGNATDFDVYNRTQSHVMSEDKPGELQYHVFDYTHPDVLSKPFYERLEMAEIIIKDYMRPDVSLVEHVDVSNYEELLEYENKCLEQGFEGIMMRNPIAAYKQGRGTFREGIIYKLKRFEDSEAVIIGFVEQMTNQNSLEKDELGYAKRSYAKDGLVPANTLGRFIVLWNDIELDIAPGNFNHAQRQEIWNNQDKFMNKLLKFRYFNHGIKDKPRFPRAVGFRDEMDL